MYVISKLKSNITKLFSYYETLWTFGNFPSSKVCAMNLKVCKILDIHVDIDRTSVQHGIFNLSQHLRAKKTFTLCVHMFYIWQEYVCLT